MAYEKKPSSGRGSRAGGKPSSSRDGAKSFGDKPRSGGFSKGPSKGPRGGAGRSDSKSFGDKPKRDYKPRGDFADRPKRDFDDRPKRDYKPRGDFGDRKPRGDFADKKPRRDYDDKPRRDFGDKSYKRSDDRAPKRDYKPRGDFADRPKRDFDDRPKRDYKPRGDFGDRKPRGDFADKKPRRDYDDKPRRDYDDRPKRDFGDRKPRGDFKERKTYSRDGGSRPYEKNNDRGFRERQEKRDDFNGAERMGHEQVFYGIHAVQASLRNPNRVIKKIWITERGQEALDAAFDAARHPEAEIVEKKDIERLLPEGAVHQGIAIAAEPLQDVFMSDILAAANNAGDERHVVVILDEVTDPHNVGAVMRSMSAFGAKAMIVHKRNAPGITGVVAKIATGALEHVPMIPVVNLGGALQELKNAGFFCLGLDENADYPLSAAPTDSHIALVLGAEGEGLRQKTRELCDAIANIPSLGEIKSLNVSNAAAIALYAVTVGAKAD